MTQTFLPIIIDIEASGFGVDGYPIEIGFIDENAETWCSLIKPENHWHHWDVSAEKVHKIPRSILVSRGRSVREIAMTLNEMLKNKTVYSDGWAHDYVWMAKLFESANITPRFKLEDLRMVLDDHQESNWHATKDAIIDESNITRHRASSDAKVLQDTWLKSQKPRQAVLKH